jgi:hypothetical protein
MKNTMKVNPSYVRAFTMVYEILYKMVNQFLFLFLF